MTGEQKPGGLEVVVPAYEPSDVEVEQLAMRLCRADGQDPHRLTYHTVEPGVQEPYGDMWVHYLPQAREAYRALVLTAEPAEARIRELEAELEDAKTVDSDLWDWLCERDLQPDGVEFEWSDVVVALTEHETNAYDLAEKAEARATASEAKLARAVEGLEAAAQEAHGRGYVQGFAAAIWDEIGEYDEMALTADLNPEKLSDGWYDDAVHTYRKTLSTLQGAEEKAS